jgi:hypothetical protein
LHGFRFGFIDSGRVQRFRHEGNVLRFQREQAALKNVNLSSINAQQKTAAHPQRFLK